MEPVTVACKTRLDPLVGVSSVIDTETTGLNPRTDRIISFGHVRLIDGKVAETIEWFFNPGDVEIHPDALRVHGITKEFLADKPPIKGYLAGIIELVVDAIVCGHNVKFDIDMLNAEMARHRFPPLDKYIRGIFDTMTESRGRWPGKPANLNAVCERAGVSTAHREQHGALKDALLCAEALVAMHREQRSFNDLFVDIEPSVALNECPFEMPLVMILSPFAEELESHVSYLAGMSGDAPIWHSYSQASAQDEEVAYDGDNICQTHEVDEVLSPT